MHGVRSLGSSALDLAFVASGQVDIMLEGGPWEWDVCAGLALLREAGGLYVDGNAPPTSDSAQWKPEAELSPASLGGRRFLCVRAARDREAVETARQAQHRVVRDVWKLLHLGGLQYQRDGVDYPA